MIAAFVKRQIRPIHFDSIDFHQKHLGALGRVKSGMAGLRRSSVRLNVTIDELTLIIF